MSLSPSLARAVPAVLARVKAAFDLGCDPAAVAAALGPLAAARPGLRVPGTCDPFELAVRAVAGQQITVAAARTLLTRLAAAFGAPLVDAVAGRGAADRRLFPTAARWPPRRPGRWRRWASPAHARARSSRSPVRSSAATSCSSGRSTSTRRWRR